MEQFDGNVDVQTTDTPVDYYSILNAMHVERLKLLDITDLTSNSTKQELSAALFGILTHSQHLLKELSASVQKYPTMQNLIYGNAVTNIVATIAQGIPSYVTADNLATTQLANCLAEYFNFMGVLYDHLSDSDISYEVKALITEYYARYVKTENSV